MKGVPLAGILGDQQAALVGQACFEPGEAKNTYGTGCFLLMNTGRRPVASTCGLLTTVAYRLGGQPAHYALEGSVAIAGALVQWLRDNFGLIAASDGIEALARTVEDNGGVYFVPAFSGLYAPYWKDSARGVIAGLTRYANKGHLARAVLEATAFQTREVVEAMEQDSGIHLATLRADGGMVANELLMQFQADMLNRPVVRPGDAGDHRAGRGIRGGPGGGLLRGSGRSARQLGRRTAPGNPPWKRRGAAGCIGTGRRQCSGPSTGWTTRRTADGVTVVRRVHGDAHPHSVGQWRVANVLLKRSKAEGAGWMVIATGGDWRSSPASSPPSPAVRTTRT